MKLIVGLGNPGEKYRKNRHNVGFMILDKICTSWKQQNEWLVCKKESLLFQKPLTFMNNSGEAVIKLAKKNKIKSANILVIRDDVDMELGKVRGPKNNTGSGGHKGVESIIEKLQGEDFYQLKIGVGRPPGGIDTDEWVLSDFSNDELKKIESLDLEEMIENWAI